MVRIFFLPYLGNRSKSDPCSYELFCLESHTLSFPKVLQIPPESPCILRIWWPNIISNKDLWKATGQEDINLEIRKRKFRWIGHTLRKEDGEIPKAALLWNPQGNRKRGRPKNSWRRSIIKEAGRSWNELRFVAADRQKWKGLIDNLCS